MSLSRCYPLQEAQNLALHESPGACQAPTHTPCKGYGGPGGAISGLPKGELSVQPLEWPGWTHWQALPCPKGYFPCAL